MDFRYESPGPHSGFMVDVVAAAAAWAVVRSLARASLRVNRAFSGVFWVVMGGRSKGCGRCEGGGDLVGSPLRFDRIPASEGKVFVKVGKGRSVAGFLLGNLLESDLRLAHQVV